MNGAELDPRGEVNPREAFEQYPAGAIEAMQLAQRLAIEEDMRDVAQLIGEERTLYTTDDLHALMDKFMDRYQDLEVTNE